MRASLYQHNEYSIKLFTLFPTIIGLLFVSIAVRFFLLQPVLSSSLCVLQHVRTPNGCWKLNAASVFATCVDNVVHQTRIVVANLDDSVLIGSRLTISFSHALALYDHWMLQDANQPTFTSSARESTVKGDFRFRFGTPGAEPGRARWFN